MSFQKKISRMLEILMRQTQGPFISVWKIIFPNRFLIQNMQLPA